MKFTSIALITIFGSIAANAIVQEDGSIFADGPVTVTVTCNGNIVWSKLSLLELTTAGNVLVESYNAVHELVNDDDSQLRDLVFGGNVKRSMLEGGEDNALDSWFKPSVSKGTNEPYKHSLHFLVISVNIIFGLNVLISSLYFRVRYLDGYVGMHRVSR